MRIRDGDGKQQDNIRRDAVNRFTAHYDDGTITREDIFYYTYAVLHHPEYRARYAANLKRELDRKSTRLNSSHLRLSRMPSSA